MASDAWSTIKGEPLHFLRSFRRRSLLKWFLFPGCLVAAVLNESVVWSTIGFNHWRGHKVPVLEVGPFFLLVAFLAMAHRWGPGHTAARADRQLAFKDRFVSLVDFSGRSDIPPAMQAAQYGEVLDALAGRSVRAALPLRPALFAGPLLLLASLIYPLFQPNSPIGMVTIVRLVTGPPANRDLRSDGTLDTAGNAPRPAESNRGESTPAKENGESPSRPSPQPELPPSDSGKEKRVDEDQFVLPRGDARRKIRLGEGPLVSERVGKELTKVVNPLFQENKARPKPPEEAAGGAIAFRLLPRSGKTGSGEGSGSGENPEAVTLNLDAVPETYRQLVKTYFTLLDAGAGPGGSANDGKLPGQERKD